MSVGQARSQLKFNLDHLSTNLNILSYDRYASDHSNHCNQLFSSHETIIGNEIFLFYFYIHFRNRKNGPVPAARLYIGSEPSGSRCIRLL